MIYSYCLLFDNGAAPNPFWSVCTLAICKPSIRRTAQPGDWIIGTGSAKYGFEDKLVYAMKVEKVMTFQMYDQYCKKNLPEKIPDWNSKNLKRKVGDCIYDYSTEEPVLRPSVHEGEEIIARDLRGKNVLLSTHFCYFGSDPILIKTSLLKIVRQGQGHKSSSNNPYIEEFESWIQQFINKKEFQQNTPYGFNELMEEDCNSKCTARHLKEDGEDEKFQDC